MRLMSLARIALLSLAAPAFAQDLHVAMVKNVAGIVKVDRGQDSIDVFIGMPLLKADRLVSGPGASAGIVFNDGTQLTLGSSTELSIRNYVFEPKDSKYAFSLYLTKGTAIYASGKIGKLSPESVNVDTPRASVGVRGTRFIIKAE